MTLTALAPVERHLFTIASAYFDCHCAIPSRTLQVLVMPPEGTLYEVRGGGFISQGVQGKGQAQKKRQAQKEPDLSHYGRLRVNECRASSVL